MATRTPQPWRWLAACFVVIALLYGGVAAGGSWTPKLGLDLEGGASAVLKPVGLKGKTVTASQRAQAVDVIRNRVNGLGVAEAEVSVVGDNIEVDVPGANKDQLGTLIGKTAQLRFRQVVDEEAAAAPTPTASGTPTPTTSGSVTPTPTTSGATPTTTATTTATPTTTTAPTTTPAASTKTTAPPVIKPTPTSNGRALSGALLAASATTTAPASAAATTPVASAAATSAAAPSAAASVAATGSAAATTPAAGSGTPTVAASAAPAPSASAAPPAPCKSINTTQTTACLTPDVQKQIALLGDCSPTKIAAAEAAGYDDPTKPIAACDRNGGFIYVLAPSYMDGNQVASASSQYDATQGYLVQLKFKGNGTSNFGKITTAVTSLASPLNQVAIVLDGVVESAPQINDAILGGIAQITGGTASAFTQADTDSLAQILNFGSLPITLRQETVENVSPTLGSDQLQGGLLAGGIGLALVLVYSLLYYRGLGLVTIASLAVSAVTTYASVTVLGGQIGYRLSLAGIAGFIVAVGITADSFVVYFERLRDEIREGRTLRSGAERAWVRARRTIISADTVSLLAAAILYWLSVGNVRGFAFTLGLSTITDLFVVFFFTKPLISMLARTKLYGGGGKFSGLGRQRMAGSGASNPSLASRPATTPKEA